MMKEKLFPSLNISKRGLGTYGSNGFFRNYHYRSYPKLGPIFFSIRRIPCSCHACKTKFLYPGILQLNIYPIRQYMEGYIITTIL